MIIYRTAIIGCISKAARGLSYQPLARMKKAIKTGQVRNVSYEKP